jgi:alcohol-forming fatty acyl-CoA reductase
LRTNPDVGKIYVLVKAKDGVAALKRLQNEVVDTELFRCLQEIHGKDYDGFVARKLVPVVGDVREANVGIAPALADEIADKVDVIINSAANTTFDERYVRV